MAMTLIGAGVQATVFGQFAHLIASLDGQATNFKRQMASVVDSMAYHSFPDSLKVRNTVVLTRNRTKIRARRAPPSAAAAWMLDAC